MNRSGSKTKHPDPSENMNCIILHSVQEEEEIKWSNGVDRKLEIVRTKIFHFPQETRAKENFAVGVVNFLTEDYYEIESIFGDVSCGTGSRKILRQALLWERYRWRIFYEV